MIAPTKAGLFTYFAGARLDFMYSTRWAIWNWEPFSRTLDCDKRKSYRKFDGLCEWAPRYEPIGRLRVFETTTARGNATNQRARLVKVRKHLRANVPFTQSHDSKIENIENTHATTIFLINEALSINIRKYSWNSLLSSVRWTDWASLSFSEAFSAMGQENCFGLSGDALARPFQCSVGGGQIEQGVMNIVLHYCLKFLILKEKFIFKNKFSLIRISQKFSFLKIFLQPASSVDEESLRKYPSKGARYTHCSSVGVS